MRYISVYHVALATVAVASTFVYAAPSGFEGGAPFILRSNPQQDNAAGFKDKYGESVSRRRYERTPAFEDNPTNCDG